MTTVAVIPARGGSKSIPRKNLLPLMGKPLVAWTIEQALAAELVDEVIVSSDDDEILEVAVRHGAMAQPRPRRLATDEATTDSVIQYVLDERNVSRDDPEEVVLLQCTSPMRQPGDIDGAIEMFRAEHYDTLVFSGASIEGFVWQGPFEESLDRPAEHGKRRQELRSKVYEENGSIYVFGAADFLRWGKRFWSNTNRCYEMHPLDSFQIDEPSDVELIESLWPLRMAHTMEAVA